MSAVLSVCALRSALTPPQKDFPKVEPLVNLEVLDLAGNQITQITSSLFFLTNLRELIMTGIMRICFRVNRKTSARCCGSVAERAEESADV